MKQIVAGMKGTLVFGSMRSPVTILAISRGGRRVTVEEKGGQKTVLTRCDDDQYRRSGWTLVL
jgi:hypothetical protein